MAAGEFVSVSSQRDSETADLALEQRELKSDPEGELLELRGIYERRGVSPGLALQVAEELTSRDPLGAHARDELGLHRERQARPFQAAWASALSFSAGAILPLVAIGAVSSSSRAAVCVAVTVSALAVLGYAGARLGGGSRLVAAVRVVAWGIVAMGTTSGIGALVGSAV